MRVSHQSISEMSAPMASPTRIMALMVAAVAIILTLTGCGSDSPTGPGNGQAPDYIVYFSHLEGNDMYAYHTGTGALDSFSLPVTPKWAFQISPHGKTLYTTTGTSLVAIDLNSKQVVREAPLLNSGMEICMSPDGRYLATEMPRPDHKGLQIRRTSDLSVVFEDTIWWSYGQFGQNNQCFYCRMDNTSGVGPAAVIYRLDLRTFRATTYPLHDGLPYWVIPSYDESKWFIYAYFNFDLYEFEVYDRILDSMIFRKSLVPGNGYMALTKDNRYVILSQPGLSISSVPPITYFTIFDVQANAILKEVDLYPGNPFYVVYPLCLTPDDKHLIGMPGPWPADGSFFDFDLTTMNFIRFDTTLHGKELFYPTCQTEP
jgi:hypothetical protein